MSGCPTVTVAEVGQGQGTILFRTTPAGAAIKLNGSPLISVTPYESIVNVGTYTVVYSLSGYRDCTKTVTIAADETKTVECTLTPSDSRDGDNTILYLIGAAVLAVILLSSRK